MSGGAIRYVEAADTHLSFGEAHGLMTDTPPQPGSVGSRRTHDEG